MYTGNGLMANQVVLFELEWQGVHFKDVFGKFCVRF